MAVIGTHEAARRLRPRIPDSPLDVLRLVLAPGSALVPVTTDVTHGEIAAPSVIDWREVYHDGDVDLLAVRVEGEDGGREALALRTGAAPRLTPESARALGAFLLEWADRSVAEAPRRTEMHKLGAGAIIAHSFLGQFASERSRRAMRSQFRRIAAILGHAGDDGYENVARHQLRYRETGAVRQVIVEQEGAPASKSLALAALRGVLKEAWQLGYMTAEQRERACMLEPIGGKRVKTMRSLTPGEIRTLFIACLADPTICGIRDAAIISVLYGCGVRREECAALQLGDRRTRAARQGSPHIWRRSHRCASEPYSQREYAVPGQHNARRTTRTIPHGTRVSRDLYGRHRNGSLVCSRPTAHLLALQDGQKCLFSAHEAARTTRGDEGHPRADFLRRCRYIALCLGARLRRQALPLTQRCPRERRAKCSGC